MDPLSISASIAGLIALTTSITVLSRNVYRSLNEDAAAKVAGLAQPMENFSVLLKETEVWIARVELRNKTTLLKLGPYILDCQKHVNEILKQLEIIQKNNKERKRFRKFLSALSSVDECLEALETSRGELEKSKSTLLLALSLQQREAFETGLGDIHETIRLASNFRGLEVEDLSDPKSFQEWLNRFAPDTSHDDELAAYKKKKERRQREQSGSEESNSTLVGSSTSFLSIGEISRSTATSMSTETGASDKSNFYIKVERLKNEKGETHSETICMKREARILDAIYQLEQKGYRHLCGFESLDGAHKFGPFDSWKSPIPLRSTMGSSSYDLKNGLHINENERIIDFFNDFLEFSSRKGLGEDLIDVQGLNLGEKNDDRIIGQGLTFTTRCAGHFPAIIQFRRRLAGSLEGVRSSSPYPDTELLNLYKTAHFKAKLPLQMQKKGGYLLPMFQREALEIRFAESPFAPDYTSEEFAVKLYSGSVNLVSGVDRASSQSMQPTDNFQDFIVIPAQKSFKGVQIDDKTAQEFIAMPMSWDYTIEKQVTGNEYIGGLQFEIAPRLNDNVILTPIRKKDFTSEDFFDIFKPPRPCSGEILGMQIPSDEITRQLGVDLYDDFLTHLKLKTDRHFNIDRFIDELYRTRFVHELEVARPEKTGSSSTEPDYSNPQTPLVIRAVDAILISVVAEPHNQGDATMTSQGRYFSPLLDLKHFVDMLLQSPFAPRLAESHPFASDSELPAISKQVILANGSNITSKWFKRGQGYTPLFTVIPGGGTITITSQIKWSGVLSAALGSDWEMGLGAQGKIRQEIISTSDKRVWRWDRAQFLNVQIINSVMFQEVSGFKMVAFGKKQDKTDQIRAEIDDIPPRKHTRYATDVPDSISPTICANSSQLLQLLTVSDIDRSKSIQIGTRFKKGTPQLVCACCEKRFCNIIFEPCNHTFCQICIDTEMITLPDKITCDVCGEVVQNCKTIGGIMNLPEPQQSSKTASPGHPGTLLDKGFDWQVTFHYSEGGETQTFEIEDEESDFALDSDGTESDQSLSSEDLSSTVRSRIKRFFARYQGYRA